MKTFEPRTNGTLHLRRFTQDDIHLFSALHADPDVMRDLGGPIDAVEAGEKLARYIAAFDRHGFGRLAVFDGDQFAGYTGPMHRPGADHPIGAHTEIGWRLHPRLWGKGLATRAATLALNDVFDRTDLPSVIAYTGPDNFRSQAVMKRLGMTRAPDLDFTEEYSPVGTWIGHTWRITASEWRENQRSGGSE